MRLLLAAAALLASGCETQAARDAREQREAETRVQAPRLQLTGRVVDEADLIDPVLEQQLAGQSQALEAQTTDQFVVATLDSLEGRTIEQAGLDLGNSWGLGTAKLDNGVLLLVAPAERKVRIEVGRGLEGLLTNARAAAIIQQDMLPLFRSNRHAEGIKAGAGRIVGLLAADRQRPRYAEGAHR